mgnify:CR=1 FL=1|jgi:hypothetical protein
MEFTHQNLNKDFLTTNEKKDQFADFMSIVDDKFEKDRKSTENVATRSNQNSISISNGSPPNNYSSTQKNEAIKKV